VLKEIPVVSLITIVSCNNEKMWHVEMLALIPRHCINSMSTLNVESNTSLLNCLKEKYYLGGKRKLFFLTPDFSFKEHNLDSQKEAEHSKTTVFKYFWSICYFVLLSLVKGLT
jgi:hypothetical protein